MSLLGFFTWLAQTRASVAMAESIWAFPIVESIHVLALTLFLGMAVLLDLRLVGLALRDVAVTELVDRLMPWTIAGFVIMVVSGVLVFLNAPVRYYHNIFFRIKVAALLLAGVNAWVFHAGVWLKVSSWDRDVIAPVKVRVAGALSLALWACVVVAGRLIAYNWFDKVTH
jgi:uncharacterized membrane protein